MPNAVAATQLENTKTLPCQKKRVSPSTPILMSFNLATAPVGKNVYQVAQNVYLKMYAKTRPGTGTQRMSMSPGMLGERYLMNQCAS